MLVVQGRDDEYGTLQQVTTVAERVPATVHVVVLAECGHSPHIDQRAAIEDAAAAFLRAAVR